MTSPLRRYRLCRVSSAEILLSPLPRTTFQRTEFAELVIRHQQAIYGYMRARLLEPADADDLCQEVFLHAIRLAELYDADEELRFGYWASLAMFCTNTFAASNAAVKSNGPNCASNWMPWCKKPRTAENEALAHLPDLPRILGKQCREALEMQYHARLKMQEIGTRLKRSEGAVKLLLYRARQALKHCLDVKLLGKS